MDLYFLCNLGVPKFLLVNQLYEEIDFKQSKNFINKHQSENESKRAQEVDKISLKKPKKKRNQANQVLPYISIFILCLFSIKS